jgi:exosortase/archaeosortase family protein
MGIPKLLKSGMLIFFRIKKLPRFTKDQERLWKTLIFLVRLMVLSFPMYFVLWSNLSLFPLQNVIADNSYGILRMMGYGVVRNGLMLSVGEMSTFTFYIGTDCTGWKSVLAFSALILASLGMSYRKRILGLAAGIPLIYLGNLGRIILVVLIERTYGLEAAFLFHDWLWQAGLIALVILLWLAWLRWEKIWPKLASLFPNPKTAPSPSRKSRKKQH